MKLYVVLSLGFESTCLLSKSLCIFFNWNESYLSGEVKCLSETVIIFADDLECLLLKYF